MIFYLANRTHPELANGKLIGSWAKGIAHRIQVATYESTFRMRSLRVGTYIFSGLDQLSPDETERAQFLWQTLSQSGQDTRLLNSPLRSMRRYELLRKLYELGVNDFNVYRLTESRQPERFPVFIRGENDHRGPLTPLLHTQAQLEEAIEKLVLDGKNREDKIIVELCDTADAHGVHHRYGAFIIGDEIVPRSALFSHDWVVKGASMEFLDARYVEDNPHASLLRPIFETAGIQYGRMDYAVVDGKIRVFEINMNPTLFSQRVREPEILRANKEFAHNFEAAMQGIDSIGAPTKSIPLVIPDDLGFRWRFPLVRRAIQKTLRFLNLLQYEDRLFASLKKIWGRLAQIRKHS